MRTEKVYVYTTTICLKRRTFSFEFSTYRRHHCQNNPYSHESM